MRDCLIASKIPYSEIHISNIFAREEFRRESFLSERAIGLVTGFGIYGYELAFDGIINYLNNRGKLQVGS